ncbi:spore photoproduct lyase [Brevibacillus centrosporus]|uniref:Spore photoproduct lyase n=1 Tax=Brevibacillus centrosporus TaxID=54910 RepID=A0A1I3TU30_9BACL|nr:spore photoproduct lyase [Brevibacillus centrosporus]MED4908554.1 spore photoproduct lyase [Brevibacillus centrosporus]SFJ73081.1 spore photoproduct lyase [Brevibacillus centrosporus]
MATSVMEPPKQTAAKSSQLFVPDYVFVEPHALDYPLGRELYERFSREGIPIQMTTSHNQVRGIPGETDLEKYRNAKRTLVIGVRKTLKFETSKPSAEYAIPLATGCAAHCHYCYLNTNVGTKPYIRVYVNTDDILAQAQKYILERPGEMTRFEAACTSDPVSIEHITGNLKRAIEFMGTQEFGRLRFVTKFHHVDSLLDAKHNKHTRFRFSMNADYVIKNFEPGTSTFAQRIEAAGKVARAGYPLGFILAPLYWFEGWEEGYTDLLERLRSQLVPEALEDLTFELISHRFTKIAKNLILQRYPKTKLEMNEEERKYKWGKYGKGKYVYPDVQAKALQAHLENEISRLFPRAKIEYFT